MKYRILSVYANHFHGGNDEIVFTVYTCKAFPKRMGKKLRKLCRTYYKNYPDATNEDGRNLVVEYLQARYPDYLFKDDLINDIINDLEK